MRDKWSEGCFGLVTQKMKTHHLVPFAETPFTIFPKFCVIFHCCPLLIFQVVSSKLVQISASYNQKNPSMVP